MQVRLCAPEVSIQPTVVDEPLTPPDICPSTATRATMLTLDDALDVAKHACRDDRQLRSEQAWTLAADEITVEKD